MRAHHRFNFSDGFEIVDNLPMPFADFFRLLKTEVNGSFEFRFHSRKFPRKGQKNCDVAVVPARMHTARML